MIAGEYNILCEQGTTFVRVFSIEEPDPGDDSIYIPMDLTGYTARMHVRRTVESSDYIISLTTENNRISIVGLAGEITLTLSAEETAEITSSGVYDLEIIDSGGIVSRPIKGKFTLDREVTR